MTFKELLTGTIEFFDSDPSRWIRGSLAETTTGQQINNAIDPGATHWCAVGGTCKVAGARSANGEDGPGALVTVLTALNEEARKRDAESLADFNDDIATEWADVRPLFCDALEAHERGDV